MKIAKFGFCLLLVLTGPNIIVDAEVDVDYDYSVGIEKLKAFTEKPVETVLSQGDSIPFKLNIDNHNWIRPIYSSVWDSEFYQQRYGENAKSIFVQLAQHRLFQSPVGASVSAGFFGPIGLPKEKGKFPKEDFSPEHVGQYILNGKVTDVKRLGNQIAIFAEPTRKGFQEIWIKYDELPERKALFHLVTPGGYEIDYLPLFFKSGEGPPLKCKCR
jgi:hypothetical protein